MNELMEFNQLTVSGKWNRIQAQWDPNFFTVRKYEQRVSTLKRKLAMLYYFISRNELVKVLQVARNRYHYVCYGKFEFAVHSLEMNLNSLRTVAVMTLANKAVLNVVPMTLEQCIELVEDIVADDVSKWNKYDPQSFFDTYHERRRRLRRY